MSACSGDSFDFLSDIDSDGMSHRSESVENLDEGAEMLPSSSFEEEAVEKSACEEETDSSFSTAHDEDEAAEWELMPRKEHKKEVEKLREQIQSERKNNSLILDMIMMQTDENEAQRANSSQSEEMKTVCEDMKRTFADIQNCMQSLNINLLEELKSSNEKCEQLEEEAGKLREQIQSERENNALLQDMIRKLTEANEARISSQLEEMKTMCEDLEKSFSDNTIEMERLNINLPKELKASIEKCEKLEEENAKLTIEKNNLKVREIMRERMLDVCNEEILKLNRFISAFEKKHNSLIRSRNADLQEYKDFVHRREREMIDKLTKPLQEALEEQERVVQRAVQRVKAAYEGRDLENQNEKIDV